MLFNEMGRLWECGFGGDLEFAKCKMHTGHARKVSEETVLYVEFQVQGRDLCGATQGIFGPIMLVECINPTENVQVFVPCSLLTHHPPNTKNGRYVASGFHTKGAHCSRPGCASQTPLGFACVQVEDLRS